LDRKGSAVFQNVPVNNDPLNLQLIFGPAANPVSGPQMLSQGAPLPASASSPSNYTFVSWDPNNSALMVTGTPAASYNISGSVVQADGNAAGLNEPFFAVQDFVGVTDAQFYQYSTTVNDWNDFSLLLSYCSGIAVAIGGVSQGVNPCTPGGTSPLILDVGTLTLAKTGSPIITSLTATYNGGSSLSGQMGPVLPVVKTGFPSDSDHPQADFCLAFKGSDNRNSACRYYQAIGAVPANGCDVDGNFSTAPKASTR
jgi:hypothetical protein